MADSLPWRRYLDRHIEPDLPDCPHPPSPWRHVLVIPCYRESPGLLDNLKVLATTPDPALVILVLNRPDSDPGESANTELRIAISQLPSSATPGCYLLGAHTDLYLLDLDQHLGALPAKQGVGLARKAGCDLAIKWCQQGAIDCEWLCSSDADARLPGDYFQRLDSAPDGASAALFPFCHAAGSDEDCNSATALYELRLHHYVLGLEYAGSPYAYHTLGSCIAIRPDAYVQVRGYPRRSGGEDFYLLNKARKLGAVTTLKGRPIALQSRLSRRAPFGTGPAVKSILDSGDTMGQRLFYHPACFQALRGVLMAVPELRHSPSDLHTMLCRRDLPPSLAEACAGALQTMGLESALDHCRRQGGTEAQYLRQFHQWFDAFRTLKFIHHLRDAGWENQSLSSLEAVTPSLWPSSVSDASEVEHLRSQIRAHWGWEQISDW